MARMVTIAEAAKALDCTASNIYQRINRYSISTQDKRVERREVVKRKITVRYVDLDELERYSK